MGSPPLNTNRILSGPSGGGVGHSFHHARRNNNDNNDEDARSRVQAWQATVSIFTPSLVSGSPQTQVVKFTLAPCQVHVTSDAIVLEKDWVPMLTLDVLHFPDAVDVGQPSLWERYGLVGASLIPTQMIDSIELNYRPGNLYSSSAGCDNEARRRCLDFLCDEEHAIPPASSSSPLGLPHHKVLLQFYSSRDKVWFVHRVREAVDNARERRKCVELQRSAEIELSKLQVVTPSLIAVAGTTTVLPVSHVIPYGDEEREEEDNDDVLFGVLRRSGSSGDVLLEELSDDSDVLEYGDVDDDAPCAAAGESISPWTDHDATLHAATTAAAAPPPPPLMSQLRLPQKNGEAHTSKCATTSRSNRQNEPHHDGGDNDEHRGGGAVGPSSSSSSRHCSLDEVYQRIVRHRNDEDPGVKYNAIPDKKRAAEVETRRYVAPSEFTLSRRYRPSTMPSSVVVATGNGESKRITIPYAADSSLPPSTTQHALLGNPTPSLHNIDKNYDDHHPQQLQPKRKIQITCRWCHREGTTLDHERLCTLKPIQCAHCGMIMEQSVLSQHYLQRPECQWYASADYVKTVASQYGSGAMVPLSHGGNGGPLLSRSSRASHQRAIDRAEKVLALMRTHMITPQSTDTTGQRDDHRNSGVTPYVQHRTASAATVSGGSIMSSRMKQPPPRPVRQVFDYDDHHHHHCGSTTVDVCGRNADIESNAADERHIRSPLQQVMTSLQSSADWLVGSPSTTDDMNYQLPHAFTLPPSSSRHSGETLAAVRCDDEDNHHDHDEIGSMAEKKEAADGGNYTAHLSVTEKGEMDEHFHVHDDDDDSVETSNENMNATLRPILGVAPAAAPHQQPKTQGAMSKSNECATDTPGTSMSINTFTTTTTATTTGPVSMPPTPLVRQPPQQQQRQSLHAPEQRIQSMMLQRSFAHRGDDVDGGSIVAQQTVARNNKIPTSLPRRIPPQEHVVVAAGGMSTDGGGAATAVAPARRTTEQARILSSVASSSSTAAPLDTIRQVQPLLSPSKSISFVETSQRLQPRLRHQQQQDLPIAFVEGPERMKPDLIVADVSKIAEDDGRRSKRSSDGVNLREDESRGCPQEKEPAVRRAPPSCRWCNAVAPLHDEATCAFRKMRCKKCGSSVLFNEKEMHRQICDGASIHSTVASSRNKSNNGGGVKRRATGFF